MMCGLLLAAFSGSSSHAAITDDELSQMRAQQARETDEETQPTPGFRIAPIPREVESAPVSFGDADLGEQWILKGEPKYDPFLLFGDVAGFQTSNAALTKSNTMSDFFMVARVGASYQPRFSDTLQGEVTVSQALFRYSDLDALDFDSTNVGAGLTYIAAQLWNVAFFTRYNYTYLSDDGIGDQIFQSNSITLGAQKSFVFTRSHYAYAGVSGLFGWSNPRFSQRNEFALYGGYHMFLTRALEFDSYANVSYYDYTGSRSDFNGSLNLALRYNFTKWLSVTGSFSMALDRSNQSVFDYNVYNGGLGLSVMARF
jgi:hypothetical protein